MPMADIYPVTQSQTNHVWPKHAGGDRCLIENRILGHWQLRYIQHPDQFRGSNANGSCHLALLFG